MSVSLVILCVKVCTVENSTPKTRFAGMSEGNCCRLDSSKHGNILILTAEHTGSGADLSAEQAPQLQLAHDQVVAAAHILVAQPRAVDAQPHDDAHQNDARCHRPIPNLGMTPAVSSQTFCCRGHVVMASSPQVRWRAMRNS